MKAKAINSILIILGATIAGIGINFFLEPMNIAPGGISGAAVLLSRLLKGKLSVGMLTIIINIPLFVIGYILIGRKFVVKSIVGTFIFSIMVDITSHISVMTGGENKLLFALWGGVVTGCGFGMIFRGGASTGGTDIIARILQKKVQLLTIGNALLIMDLIFLAIVALVYKSVEAALYTGVTVFVASKVVDVVEAGINYAKEIWIVTEAPNEIAENIIGKMGRGVSLIEAKGMYSKRKKSILICVVFNRQVSDIRKIIKKYDQNAFVTIKEVREANKLVK